LKSLIEQSYSIFNIYGKTADDAKNILGAFADVLATKDIKTITRAFRDWMESESTFPTPSDILKRCNRFVTRYEGNARPAPKRNTSANNVPWASKLWDDFTDDDKRQLAEHLNQLGKAKALDYLKYLKHHCLMDKEAYMKALAYVK